MPFKQALKFPFHFYGKTEFATISGEFKIQAQSIHFGMIVFGGKHEVVISSNVPTRIHNSGIIEFYGKAVFARGVNLMVWQDATLSFGSDFSIGSLSRIICFRRIIFGNNVLISWECQFFDTDFHFIVNNNKSIKDNCGIVSIGNEVWIGARSTILKNTFIAEESIIGANSVCTGNYEEKDGKGVLLVGSPAKSIKNNVSYLKNKKQEMDLFQHFSKNHNQEIDWNN